MSDYSTLVVEHFTRPRNVGSWPPAADIVQGNAGSFPQGVQFTLSAQVAGGLIQAARFSAYGCPHCIAAASWLTEQLCGWTHSALQHWHWREAARVLQVPTQKYGRLLILEDALRSLATDWERQCKIPVSCPAMLP